MRNIRGAGLRRLAGPVALAAIAMGLALPQLASASPGPVWKVAGNELGSSMTVKASGSVKFTDTKGGFFGESLAVKCAVSGEASVGSNGLGEVLALKTSGCVSSEGICPSPTVAIKKLSWDTELTNAEGKARESIAAGSKGSPEYQLVCEGVTAAECSGATSVSTSNALGGVSLGFDTSSATLKCTPGGEHTGKLSGTITLENPATGQLTVSDAPAAEGWFVNGGQAPAGTEVKTSGSLKFRSKAGVFGEEVEISCAEEGEGLVGPHTAGEVTKWTTSGCATKTGVCPEPSVYARNLPWHTELVLGGEGLIERLGKGKTAEGQPEYEVRCNGSTEYGCSWPNSAAMKNSSPEENVEAWYTDELFAGSCSPRGSSGSAVTGKETVKARGVGKVLSVKSS